MRNARLAAVSRLEAYARSRLGLFTEAEAKAIGVSRSLVGYHNRESGRWSRVLPCVYELAEQPADRRRSLLAAQLWAGNEAVLSHWAAGWILELDGIRAPRPELWTPRGRPPSGITVHRGVVGPDEVTVTGPLRHTSALRTIVDLAPVVDDDTLELVAESAFRRNPASESDLRLAALRPTPPPLREGAARLQRFLDRRPVGAPPTESELETRFLQIMRITDLPPPERQFPVVVGGRCVARLDFYWPGVRLWVELDGRTWHDRPQALLYDRHRQNEVATQLQILGLRFTWDDVMRRSVSTARFTEAAYHRRAFEREHGYPNAALRESE